MSHALELTPNGLKTMGSLPTPSHGPECTSWRVFALTTCVIMRTAEAPILPMNNVRKLINNLLVMCIGLVLFQNAEVTKPILIQIFAKFSPIPNFYYNENILRLLRALLLHH